MIYDVLFFIAMLATALALGAAMAHALELPNKINLSAQEYFIAQKAYRGWNRLGWLLLVQWLSIVAVAYMSRGEPSVFWPVVVPGVFLLCAQAVF